MLIHIQLFGIYPVLVIIPTLVLALIAHFIYSAMKSTESLKLKALFGITPTSSSQVTPVVEKPKARTSTIAALVIGEENIRNSEEGKSISSLSSNEGDDVVSRLPMLAGGNTQTLHKTRRQSIQEGVSLLQLAKQSHNHDHEKNIVAGQLNHEVISISNSPSAHVANVPSSNNAGENKKFTLQDLKMLEDLFAMDDYLSDGSFSLSSESKLSSGES